MLQVCNEVDSSSFVTFDQDPSCTQDPCSVVRTTCVVKEMVEWLGRNCTDPATVNAEGDDCISAASAGLLASYGLERVPDVSCFSMSVAEEDRCLLPQDKANRTPTTILPRRPCIRPPRQRRLRPVRSRATAVVAVASVMAPVAAQLAASAAART